MTNVVSRVAFAGYTKSQAGTGHGGHGRAPRSSQVLRRSPTTILEAIDPFVEAQFEPW